MPSITENEIKRLSDFPPVTRQLLINRSITEKDKIEEFFNPDFDKHNFDPYLINDMKPAIEKVIKHIKAQDKIVIYGDYDTDGVTSTVLLYEVLNIFRAQVDVYLPDRFTEGYGLNKKAIQEIAASGVSLIITVDTGIRNAEEVEKAKKMGLDIIITDHHTPPKDKDDIPDCPVINPNIAEDPYPYKFLAGVGVAYKFAKALISKAKIEDNLKEKLEKRLLDLVSLGTIADCVSLVGENRMLVIYGLKALNKTRRIGLLDLIKIAKIEKGELDAWNIGFQISPRLNAAGRMEHANSAFELLVTKDKKMARQLASRLNERNQERQQETEIIMSEVENLINTDDKILVGACLPGQAAWNEGVIGLVAGRITEKYHRPSLVITHTEEGYKGSGRSIPGFSIVAALENCREHLTRFGGHPGACGFSLTKEKLNDFVSCISKYTNKHLKSEMLSPEIMIEKELLHNEINEDLIKEINRFKPFGEGNHQPKFMTRGFSVLDKFHMGIKGNHVKFKLKAGEEGVFSAVGFSQAEKWDNIKVGDNIDMVYYSDINEFNGKREIQLRIIDLKPSK